MDKQQITTFIKEQISSGKISKEDLQMLVNESESSSEVIQPTPISKVPSKEESSKQLINTFYVIGAIIVLVGVIILIAQNWNEIGFIGRMLVTLGISVGAYLFGLSLRGPEHRIISQVMFVVSALLAPLGSFVLLTEASVTITWEVQILLSSVLFIIFGSALLISKRNVLSLITIGFATWTYYTLGIKLFGSNFFDTEFLKWATMLLGASYILIGYGYQSVLGISDTPDGKEKRRVQEVLYRFGVLAILGAGISIGGIFDLFFIAFIFAAFYGSVYLKSRTVLVLGALFLMAHIIKLTSIYFAQSIGWPIALIIVGFLVIAVGYMTLYLNKKYISS